MNIRTLKAWSTILFMLGMLLLGLFGYGKYFRGYIYSTRYLRRNPAILPIAVPMLVPYIILTFVDLFLRTKKANADEVVETKASNNLAESGRKMVIFFETAVTDMKESIVALDGDLQILKEELIPISRYFKNEHPEVYTEVDLKYKVDKRDYQKRIVLPFSLENTKTCLNIEKQTVLIYEEYDPSKAIVDMEFIEKYL